MIVELCQECGDESMTRVCANCSRDKARRAAAANKKMYPAVERARMRDVTARAKKDKEVCCWLCLRRYPPPGYDPLWVADHEEAGVVGSRLHAAHRGCNSARGNRAPSQFRQGLAAKFPAWFTEYGSGHA